MKQLIVNIDDGLYEEIGYISSNIIMSIDEYILSLINEDLKKRKEKLMDEIVAENREAFEELAK